MLKLAKGIKIELLENYGFEKRYDEKTGLVSHYYNPNWQYKVDVKKRIFHPTTSRNISRIDLHRNLLAGNDNFKTYEEVWTNKDLDYLYDIIKDGLVIKEGKK